MGEVEDLSDERIDELLRKAEERLGSQNGQTVVRSDEHKSYRFPQLDTGALAKPHIRQAKYGATVLREGNEIEQEKKKDTMHMRKVENPVMIRKQQAEKATAGERWYNLPKTDLTPELKRDLQILKMRNVLDPHRHYKKEGGKMKAPEYSQVGTIIEGPTEYYSSRLNNRERKRTFVEEVLAGEQETSRFKRKYGDVQAKKTSGKKAFYKSVQAKRTTSFKKR
ncbi:Fcf2 pre-rRNA processing-domain-containing protein [Elsinoe ampelina]|uniref:Fcf2 pre-rRNA processing-domain-containing protein n=1 Tax=Elsinoe ampelina TaxID=302913 RepID=A0A6A6GR57_9PEZI|nr:Fcf2 pre-rRNA processing-domain-containing protein [Elsinoe ampelina]